MFSKFIYVTLAVIVMTIALLSSWAHGVDAKKPKWNELEGYTFDRYIKDFRKPYPHNSPHYHLRKRHFEESLKFIVKHNAEGKYSWKAGVNAFTDMSKEEFKKMQGFKKSPMRAAPESIFTGDELKDVPLPREVDWRTATSPRVVTEVKHQGSCGSCWAHSTIEALETYYAFQTSELPVLSVEQINTCVPAPASYGCDGGDYAAAWSWMKAENVAVNEEWSQPYSNFFFPTTGNPKTSPCYNVSSKFPNKQPYAWYAELTQVGVRGYVSVTPNNVTAARRALASIGPQSISVAAGCHWQHYDHGFYEPTDDCSDAEKWSIDHAVYLVGYVRSEDSGERSWIVRNSWGSSWGVHGYIYIKDPTGSGQPNPCSPKEFGPVCGYSGCLSDLQYPLVVVRPTLPY